MNTRLAFCESASHEDPPRPPESGAPEIQPKLRRGFAVMDRKVVSEIASRGGKAAHSAGTAHQFTSDEARVAGRKGGRATHARRREALQQQRDVPPESAGQRGDKDGQ
jgi:general stress protein YciG